HRTDPLPRLLHRRLLARDDGEGGDAHGRAPDPACRANPSSGLSATFSHKGRRHCGTIADIADTGFAVPSPSPLVGEGARRADEGLARQAPAPRCSTSIVIMHPVFR